MTENKEDRGKNDSTSGTWCCSSRLSLAIMTFLGFANLYALRVNMSVSIVCMVNQTAILQDHNSNLYEGNTSDRDDDQLQKCYLNSNDNVSSAEEINSKDGEFIWNKPTQGLILGLFYLGYTFTQIPGGWLAVKFGGKRVFGWSMFICAIVTLLTPIAAKANVIFVMVLRFVNGMCQGVVLPSMHALWTYWAPPLERSRLIGFSFAGAHIGNVIAFPLAGALCKYGFDGGWPSIFYTFGGIVLLWFIAWMFLVYDTPEKHPRISQSEKHYIQHSLSGQTSKNIDKKASIPWTKILSSMPVWAIIVSQTCAGWLECGFITNTPSYLSEVLKFDIGQNGLISSLPFLGILIVNILSGIFADAIIKKGILGITNTRKLNNSIGMFLPSVFCIGLGYLDCTQRVLAVTFLVAALSLFGCIFGAGCMLNHADIAPKYASVVFAIANTVAATTGFVGPYITGVITTNQTQQEWRMVFLITAIVVSSGSLFYLIFGSGDLQEWAKDRSSPEINVAVLEVKESISSVQYIQAEAKDKEGLAIDEQTLYKDKAGLAKNN